MKIPVRFRLLGQTIEVKSDDAHYRDTDWEGSASYRRNEIKLQSNGPQIPLKPEMIEQTFLHELVHYICYQAGAAVNHELKKPLHQNEEFVDLFAGLLHQTLTTMEYEDDPA